MPDFAMPEHHTQVIAPAPLVLAVNWPTRLPHPQRLVTVGWLSHHGGQLILSAHYSRRPARVDEPKTDGIGDAAERTLALGWVADALFCSRLEVGERPTARQMSAAIRQALAQYQTWGGCMRAVIDAFMQDEDKATERQLWCRRIAVEGWTAGLRLGRPPREHGTAHTDRSGT